MRHNLTDKKGRFVEIKSRSLERMVSRVENIRGKIAYDLKKTKSVPIEIYKNRCLQAVEKVGRMSGVSTKQKHNAKERLFKVYTDLQEYSGSERQVWDHDKEVQLGILTHSAEARSGGLGFSTARGLMLAEGITTTKNEYYNELNAIKCADPSEVIGTLTSWVHVPKQTRQDWREDMARQKKEVLDGC
tara:strand:+ start:612 stop:1175 length:564 start_codon:yes stop_codon:yes gene_type:complete